MNKLSTKEVRFMKFKAWFLFGLSIIFLLYYILITSYAGFRLSMSWFWPLATIVCLTRSVILIFEILGIIKMNRPMWLRITCRASLILILISFLAIESRVISCMHDTPDENIDCIIVLGAKVLGSGNASNPFQARIDSALEYALDNPDVSIIVSGGQGPDEPISEALCAKNYLVSNGVDAGRILIEDKSTDTIENLKFSYELIPENSANVAIVTNGFHIYRAKTIAKKVGYSNIFALPAKTLFPIGPHYVVREYFGMLKELLTM